VLPEAVGFLQNVNATSFDALVQARSYYSFIFVTTGLELVPMLLLYELSIVVAGVFERRFPSGVHEETVEHGQF
jgi:Sec-independent protein secretion pathway component TatC